MTSKEALDFILNNVIFPDNMDKEGKQEVYKKIDEIEKDLEVLEIFKTQFCIKTQKAYFNKRPMFIINIMGHDIFIPRVIYDKLYKWLKRGVK